MAKGFRGGMGELMRQANRVQRKIEQRKEELKEELSEAMVGNDQVKAVVNGAQEVVELTIDPALLKDEDLSMVQDLVLAAVNAALQKSRTMVESELEKVSGGLNIPGMV